MSRLLCVSCSVGDALDKLSILRIKEKYFEYDQDKLFLVEKEIGGILSALREVNIEYEKVKDQELYLDLCRVNNELWNLETEIRNVSVEDRDRLIKLSISIRNYNDYRARIKMRLNVLYDSDLIEVKSHIPLIGKDN